MSAAERRREQRHQTAREFGPEGATPDPALAAQATGVTANAAAQATGVTANAAAARAARPAPTAAPAPRVGGGGRASSFSEEFRP